MQIRLTTGRRKSEGLGKVGVTAAVLSIALILAGVMYRPVMYIACVFVMAYMAFTSTERMWYHLFILIPFANIFKFDSAGTSIFTYLQFLAIGKVLISKRKLDRRFMQMYLVLVVINVLGSQSNFTMLLKQCAVPMTMYCFFRTKPQFKTLLLAFASSILAASAIALLRERIPNLAGFLRQVRAWEVSGVVYRFSGLYSDPNYYSLTLLAALVGMMVLYNNQQIGFSFLPYLAAVAVFGGMTISKSFLLMFAALCCFFALSQFQRGKYAWGLLLAAALMMGVLLILQGRIAIFDNVLSRLFSNGDLTTNRTTIWGEYFDYLFGDVTHFLFGAGIGAGYLKNSAAPHSTYIDLLYYYGVLGLAVFLMTCKLALGKKIRMPRNINHYIMIVAMAAMFFFLSSLQTFDFSYVVILMYMCYQSRELAYGVGGLKHMIRSAQKKDEARRRRLMKDGADQRKEN